MPPRKRGAADPAAHEQEVQFLQRLFARERLSLDETEPGRTTFLSHLGAQPRLVPGPWIGHRELMYALALANLTPAQRTSLARAVLVEHRHEFGVGRLVLEAIPSGLPFGGSSVRMRHRTGGPVCLYTWALGQDAQPAACDWLLLRAQPEWAKDDPPPVLAARGLDTLAALGGEVLVLIASAVAAVQIASACRGVVPLAAHPRFSPHLEQHVPEAAVLLWPHDALDGAGLRRREVTAVVLVGAPEQIRLDAQAWRDGQARAERIELAHATCPGRMGRDELAAYWVACGRPKVLLRGDAQWAKDGARFLVSIGATVELHSEATQLELI